LLKNTRREASDLECLDCGLVLEQNGNPVPNRVDPLALVAFQAFFAAEHQRLAAHRTSEDFEQVRRNHDEAIVAASRSSPFAIRFSCVALHHEAQADSEERKVDVSR
jgi:hypothetical protein